MDLKWRRPTDLPFPKVHHRFHSKDIYQADKLVSFVVQDLPEDRFEDAIHEMAENFLRDENTCRTTGTKSFKIVIKM